MSLGEVALSSLFQEPSEFYESEKPAHYCEHQLLSGQTVRLRLVGKSPLWGHYLWNAGRVTSHYLEENADRLVSGKTVLELGAGAGLPGIICGMKGARKVVITDYPDRDLIDNLRQNVQSVSASRHLSSIIVEGYLWGSPSDKLLSVLDDPSDGYDVLILADLVFNHSEHAKLIQSVQKTLKRSSDARALVFFSPYRPWLLQQDLAFFSLARSSGFTVEKVLETVMDKVMFDEDPGDELLRRTVFGYELKWEQKL